MRQRESVVAGLLFGSGLCALVYQTAWLREFRLIFGASTYATAAVLAIFMAGLGVGSALLGKRADLRARPLRLYGLLEVSIALAAALSPLLLLAVRKLYLAMGGSVTLGLFFGTIVRLIFALLVIGIPTFLMGGTLPAAARSVESNDDRGRRRMALLYGSNTLGAVAGTLLATFWMLEHLGNRFTLLAAAAVNLVVGLLAIAIARPVSAEEEPVAPVVAAAAAAAEVREPAPDHNTLPPRWVLLSSAVVGFAFLLMELVWYRMLTPILGGTTFTFGLILAFALLGIGLGGAAYALWSGARQPTPRAFALTCTLEAAAMIIPFALGDRIAILSNLLRPLGNIGFVGHVMAWSLVTAIVVLPAAFIAGVQFPILVALLGSGRDDVGRHVGMAYAYNTAGAIAGSLAGGFGLLPLLTAPGAWRLATAMLVLLGLAVAVRGSRLAAHSYAVVWLVAVVALAAMTAAGPSAVWRHTGIGAGRAPQPKTINALREWMHVSRRVITWEEEGRESSIALADANDRSLVVNGKVDGSARGDAGMQVMSGLLGSMLHPRPRTALVVGLGTGTTAGWLAAIPSMTRVDVVELEPAVLTAARAYSAVNREAMTSPKVHIAINDAREVLLAGRRRYDLIFSEPSNPYRAGIASLYTREFYEAASERLQENGIYLAWVQGYDVDALTVRTIYSTLRSVFPHIQTWRTSEADIVLLASRSPLIFDMNVIRQRLTEEPYASAIRNAWRVDSAEGVLAHFIANEQFATAIGVEKRLNTDDQTLIEFGFARTLGETGQLSITDIADRAEGMGAGRPAHLRGEVDWSLVELNRASDTTLRRSGGEPRLRAHREFARAYEAGAYRRAYEIYRTGQFGPVNARDLSRLGEVLATQAVPEAERAAQLLRGRRPAEAEAILAQLRLRQGRLAEATAHLEQAFAGFRADAWSSIDLMRHSLDAARQISQSDRQLASRLFEALQQPFAAAQWEDYRRIYRLAVASNAEGGCGPRTLHSLQQLEPHVPWTEWHLRLRRVCYARAGLDVLASDANRDLQKFHAARPRPLL